MLEDSLEGQLTVIRVDAREITDWASFHITFKRLFGFPDFYGHNVDAWIDCMSDLDAPEHGMTAIHVPSGQILTIRLEHSLALRQHPDVLEGLLEMVDFVNLRRQNSTPSQPAVLAVQIAS